MISTPTLSVTGLPKAIALCERAWFGVRLNSDRDVQPGDFAFVEFDRQSVFDLDVDDIDQARNGAGCYLIVKEADEWHTGWQPSNAW